MSLRHALLGLLTAHPMSGYDLTKVFDRSVAYMWHAPHSQIYPELRRMEGDGLVAAESTRRGQRGVKRIYSITPVGVEEFRQWVSEVTIPDRVRDAQRLKAAYLEFGDFDNARRHLQSHLEHYERWEHLWSAHAEELAARAAPFVRERLATAELEDQDAVVAFKVHAYRGLVAQARTEIAWAKDGLRLVGELEAADHR
jgi:DNA-binding PadR family transcriptional regulator